MIALRPVHPCAVRYLIMVLGCLGASNGQIPLPWRGCKSDQAPGAGLLEQNTDISAYSEDNSYEDLKSRNSSNTTSDEELIPKVMAGIANTLTGNKNSAFGGNTLEPRCPRLSQNPNDKFHGIYITIVRAEYLPQPKSGVFEYGFNPYVNFWVGKEGKYNRMFRKRKNKGGVFDHEADWLGRTQSISSKTQKGFWGKKKEEGANESPDFHKGCLFLVKQGVDTPFKAHVMDNNNLADKHLCTLELNVQDFVEGKFPHAKFLEEDFFPNVKPSCKKNCDKQNMGAWDETVEEDENKPEDIQFKLDCKEAERAKGYRVPTAKQQEMGVIPQIFVKFELVDINIQKKKR